MTTTMPRILVVEDETQIQELIGRYLHQNGFEVVNAATGPEGLKKAAEGVDLIILDLMLPGLDGLEVLRQLRSSGSLTPIIIVSARGEESDQVVGLEVGADDYMTKPFRPRELVARVKATLRRSKMPSVESVQAGPLVVDPEARTVRLDGELVELTPREYDLLKTLAMAPGKNFSREELLDRVWGPDYYGQARRVDMYVSKLRAKLSKPGKPAPIRSVWGVGYRIET